MRNKFYKKAVLVIFMFVLSASFIFPHGFAHQAKAWFEVYSYISNFSISAETISYTQERDGYVCIKAYLYDPEHIDPDYPQYPYEFIDYDHPIDIYSGSFETFGSKNVSWQGRDQNGNTVGMGLYMFEAAIHYAPGCGWPAVSWYAEQKEFEVTQPPPPQSWSFAIITDLHVGSYDSDYGDFGWNDGTSGDENNISVENLKNSVALINSNGGKYNLKFVVVTGDFTDSAELSELNKAKEILNTLNIPWIPILGNHDVWPYYGEKWKLIGRENEMAPQITNENGTDKYFYDLFDEQYQKLANILQNWEKQAAPSWNPSIIPVRNSYFQNFEFDFNGYHFMGLDFNDRENEIYPLKGAAAEGNLHDFNSGTWRWFLYNLQEYISSHSGSYEKIILLAHHPFGKDYWKSFYDFKLYNIGFSDEELKTIHESLVPYRDGVYALFAGHTHKTKEYSFFGDTLEVIETAANVSSPLARLVQFYPDGRIDYSKMLGNGMIIATHSPVDLEVTDPDNLLINKLTSSIPGASYFEEDIDGDGGLEDFIEIAERKDGNYQIRVIPEPGAAPDATYSLDVSVLEDNFGYTPIILAQNVLVSEIPTEPYSFQAQERTAVNLSYNGDLSGQYSDSVNLSAVLTDVNDAPLPNKDILFEIGEQTVSAVTDSGGIASASLTLNQAPGKYYLVEANFAGDEDYLPASDTKDLEILKEDAIINVLEKEGFAFDKIILEAKVKDGDGQNFLQEAEIEFKIDSGALGISQIDEIGIATSSWQVDLIPKEITENYIIEAIFTGNDYYQPSHGQANFLLKSAKWLKQEAALELSAIETNDKKLNLEIQAAKKLIQDSLTDNLWHDASRLIFFEGDCFKKSQFEVEPEKIDAEKLFETGKTNGLSKNCSWLKSGLRVFGDEYLAVKILQKKISGKPKISDEQKNILSRVVDKLTKADYLIVKVSIYDAKNTSIKNSSYTKAVELQISKAKEQLIKAEEELSKSAPGKAIIRLAISWLRSQLAIKFANLEKL